MSGKQESARASVKGQGKQQSTATRKRLTFVPSPSCQKIVKASEDFIEIQSDLAHPRLRPILLGYQVNGISLCPTALWADVALTLAEHLSDNAQQKKSTTGLNVSSLIVKSPLPLSKGKQIYRASGHLDTHSRSIWVEIFSINDFGKVLAHHAECVVKLEDTRSWRQGWERGDAMVQERIAEMLGSESNEIRHVTRDQCYKLLEPVLQYSTAYKGMDFVACEQTELEASGRLTLMTPSTDDKPSRPCSLDVFCQVALFIANVNSKTEFRCTGWDSLRIAGPLTSGIVYHSHVRLQETANGSLSGDIYVQRDDHIIAAVRGVRFQNVTQQDADEAPALTKSAAPRAAVDQLSTSMAALSIIAKEVGIRIGEMSPDDAFGDFGLDSLLSVTITKCLRSELGLEVDSSLFATCPTVKQLVDFIDGTDTGEMTATPNPIDGPFKNEMSSISSSSAGSPYASDGGSVPTTPPSSIASSEDGDEGEHDKKSISMAIQIRDLIAEEAGVESHEVKGCTTLGELGFDSLLAVTLSSRLREYLNKRDITPTIFADEASTCDDVLRALGLGPVATRTVVSMAGHR